ncbi:GlxA family transcriptional regulator [Pseudoruegeria sp. HB172150]|uniref:GlxA family transcriptional regulator n=1 Tax=Pseudoruegeria sp. HB172150 TaxID=2721164 RepID=UPI0020A6D284|nr:helix-turn-helix domain-containing protein [Pseudoruegeria sp. HB172150]
MSAGAAPEEIGILAYPGAQLAAVHGLTDLLSIASRFSAETGGPALAVSHWSPGRSGTAEFVCTYRSTAGDAPPGILIVPPTMVDLPDPATTARIAAWLLDRHAQGVQLVSLCSGVVLLAATGLLDGRTVSTHRNYAAEITARHPQVAVDISERLIEYPGLLTAGGFMAWVDVGLLLVERLLGARVRDETARFILTDPAARSAPLPRFTPPHAHCDAAVLRAQEAVHLKDGQDVTLAAMAAAARLERRTFLRRFAAATGMTPGEYCRAVRIARARELLEGGNLPLKQIAEVLGYVDVSSFTRAFRRAHGLPPGAYRRRHGGAVAGQGERVGTAMQV